MENSPFSRDKFPIQNVPTDVILEEKFEMGKVGKFFNTEVCRRIMLERRAVMGPVTFFSI